MNKSDVTKLTANRLYGWILKLPPRLRPHPHAPQICAMLHQNRPVEPGKRWRPCVAAVTWLIGLAVPAGAGVLSGREFQNLLAGGPEGTTIVFQGGTDKIFYSPSLKNRLRLSPELGPEFLRQKILQNTVTEGVFVGATIADGKWRTISGIAGIAADTETGHGVLTLLQTFPEDTSVKAFQKRDRLYSVIIVEDAPSGVVCRRSQWEKLFGLKGVPRMTTVPCEFTVGNSVTPAGTQ
jgi:hypothetical protein